MDDEQTPPTWQEILTQIIENPRERERIAQEARVKPITLMRWAHNESRPRDDNMRQLLRAIPLNVRQAFIKAVSEDFSYLSTNLEAELDNETSSIPPPEFYARVLGAHAHTPLILYQQTMYDLLFQQMIEQLDPDRRGMAARLVRGVPPQDGRHVRSLREVSGIGTGPWERDLSSSTMFLGAESLAGAAVIRSRMCVLQNREDGHKAFPAQWVDPEQSAAAYPLLRHAKIAGCLLVSSSHPHAFSPTRLALIEHYAHLFALALDPNDFFDPNDFTLYVMPPHEVQVSYVQSFRHRVTRLLVDAAAVHHELPFHRAQELAWQSIEEDLIQNALPPDGHQGV